MFPPKSVPISFYKSSLYSSLEVLETIYLEKDWEKSERVYKVRHDVTENDKDLEIEIDPKNKSVKQEILKFSVLL